MYHGNKTVAVTTTATKKNHNDRVTMVTKRCCDNGNKNVSWQQGYYGNNKTF